ncbi:MAG: class C sortase [Oscillospiraceae bacterium]|nr:class C sortase [Oscillospiraceae bacterium]
MKKNRITTFIVVIILLAGLSLLLYPTVSDYLQTLAHRRVIAEYLSNIEEMDDTSYDELLEEALAYNAELADHHGSLLVLNEEKMQQYESLLDVTGTGMMGYIQIPSIDVSLPIYHGSSDEVLRVGVGHLSGSSLPVGGETAHTLLSGHRGLPSAVLFTHLDRLQEGDTFTLRVLRETFTYEVDQITVVEPHEVNSVKMEAGKDYCTLVTCTPYGVNSHRLLVRGHRIEVQDEAIIPEAPQTPETDLWIWVLIGGAFLLLIAVIIIILVRRYKRKDDELQRRLEAIRKEFTDET